MAGDYLVVGPNWQGEVPKAIKDVIHSTTPWAFIAGRSYTDGSQADLLKTRALQDGYRITPLSLYGKPQAQQAEQHDVPDPAPKSDPLGVFKTMDVVMKENPPPPRDDVLMKPFARVGLGPQAKGNLDDLAPAIRRGLERAIIDGHARGMSGVW